MSQETQETQCPYILVGYCCASHGASKGETRRMIPYTAHSAHLSTSLAVSLASLSAHALLTLHYHYVICRTYTSLQPPLYTTRISARTYTRKPAQRITLDR